MPKQVVLIERGVDAHRLGRDRLVAQRDQRPPDAARDQVARRRVEDRGEEQTDEIEPLVRAQRQGERGVRLHQRHAARSARPGVEALEGEDLRGGDGEREGGERQIESAETQRRKAEQEPGAETDEARDRDGQIIGNAELRRQDRRAIAADGEEGAVAERDLAVEAGEQVEADQRDGEDQHLRALIEVIAGSHERESQRRRECSDRQDRPRRDRTRHGQTLAAIRRPNRPDGRQTSTPTMIASATESLTSEPTT